jgi:hypothetical protein
MSTNKIFGVVGSATFGASIWAFTAMSFGSLYALLKVRATVEQDETKVLGKQTKLTGHGTEAAGAELIEGIFGVAHKAFVYAPQSFFGALPGYSDWRRNDEDNHRPSSSPCNPIGHPLHPPATLSSVI